MDKAIEYFISNNSTIKECCELFNYKRKELTDEIKKRHYNFKKLKFINVSSIIHNYKYDYSLVKDFDNLHGFVDIVCPKHGVFSQNTFLHKKGHGCQSCAVEYSSNVRNDTKENFIKKAQGKHGNLYTYNNVVYKKTKDKVYITCNLHGDFLQTPNDHLRGKGCLKCAREDVGWSITKWKNKGRNKLAKVYIIKCWDKDESFLKIGRTFNTVKRRFGTYKELPYFWEILKVFESTNYTEIWNKERYFHRKYKDFKYKPLKNFQGQTECFSIELLKELVTAQE